MTAEIHDFIGHKMLLVAEGNVLTSCHWLREDINVAPYADSETEKRIIDMAVIQISEYLEGKRKVFSIPLSQHGTDFRMRVWNEMRRIPYGATATYKELAHRIDRPGAFRAVANACGANPFPIIIPCHRVVASGGKMGGYTGGPDIKRSLLELESRNPDTSIV